MVTGGARSGKSSYAQAIAMSLSKNPVYVATAKNWGGDFAERIERHRKDRSEAWISIEETMDPASFDLQQKTVVIDCVTLWLTNIFLHCRQDVEVSLSMFKSLVEKLLKHNANIIFVTNEIGMGVHAETEMGRKFTDLQGWANQWLGSKCEQVIFMVSGIAMQLKG